MGKKFPRGKQSRVVLLGGLILAALVALTAGAFTYVGVITHQIDERIAQLHTQRASKFYALPPAFRAGQKFTQSELTRFVEDQGYVISHDPDEMNNDQYAWERSGGSLSLYLLRGGFEGMGHSLERLRVKLQLEPTTGKELEIRSITRTDNNESVDHFDNSPRRIGTFLAGRLRTQGTIPLSDIPVNLRLAVMAIEDINFLEHPGVSLRSTVRALLRDLRAGRFVEGGSTLTQQLMKNLFLSREKALSRKVKEALFAFVTESRHSKEEILEAYLNEVYLGQWSTHEIHGVSEGARYYFHRPVSEITLPQAATLAAIIQAPNAHDPRRYAERCIARRNLVLKKMLDGGFILPGEYEEAVRSPLGVVSADLALDNADYFMDLVMSRMPSDLKGRLDTDALTIYVTLQPYLQAAASRAINANIERLEKTIPKIKAKRKAGMLLESALIAVDPKTCSVLALQGGRSYKQTQFNRVIDGKRQPGSLFKPFVYLSAFAKSTSDNPFTPLTLLQDEPLEWKYEGQTWKPRNYDGYYRGTVTAQDALENSINVPTARVAQMVGVDSILDNLRKAGIKSPLPPVPSISLGSAEVSPLELAEAYTTLANLGKACTLRPYVEVYDEHGGAVQTDQLQQQEVIGAVPAFETVGLMKGVMTHGTGRSVMGSGLPFWNFAGKSGTTNDFKDAWFAGFSPNLLVLVWVGYDEDASVGLSGSAAALPLWVSFLQNIRPFLVPEDFTPPSDVMPVDIDPQSNLIATPRCPTHQTMYFVKGTEPKSLCPLHP